MRLDISDVVPDFPAFRVAVVVCAGLGVRPARSPELASCIAEREMDARRQWGGTELSAIPGVAAWRRAYRQFGIKKTSYRSSVERLMKNVLAGTALPEITGFVDCYNAVSLAHVLPAGADDLDRVAGDLAFRRSRPDDDFLDMGALDVAGRPLADTPKPGEVVYADAAKVLCRRWNWRQDARSAIRPETRRAVVTLQANGVGDPEAAAAELVALLTRECGGGFAVTALDRNTPVRELVEPDPSNALDAGR
jgi:DNA/RNA-binding domain of Phe-tRNA-synthetase-like protein